MRSSCALVALCLAACPAARVQRPYPPPSPPEVLEHLRSLPERAPTLNAETRTDVRLGKERVNVKVYMLAAWGGKLRFQALNPNDSTAADLASDGESYCFLDVRAGCAECGPATPERVARLVRIPLEPDEVVSVLMGSAPLLGGDDAQTTVEWDPAGGREIVTQRRGDETRRLVLDGKDRRWDLLSAETRVNGKISWKIQHKDFHDVVSATGATVRMPGASLFEEGGDTVRIDWRDQRVGEPLDEGKFRMDPPAGLPACGSRN